MHLCWHIRVINERSESASWYPISLLCLLGHCGNSLSFLPSPQLSIMYTWNFRLNMVPDKDIKWEIWAEMHYWKGRQSFSWNQQKGLDGSNASRKLSTDIWRRSRENNRFREMMETDRERCRINFTINANPCCRSKMWEGSLLQYHTWEDCGKRNGHCLDAKHQVKDFPPVVYILYQVTWKGLNYNFIIYGEFIPLRRREKGGNQIHIGDYCKRWETTSTLLWEKCWKTPFINRTNSNGKSD